MNHELSRSTSRAARATLFATLLVLCVSCDHGTKQLAESRLASGAIVTCCSDALRLELAHNPGAFLSMGAQLAPSLRGAFFILLTPVGLALFIAFAVRSGLASGRAIVGLGLVAGGGLGNWIDRLLHDGAVTDFVSVGLGRLQTGIFNVADVCIVAGIAILATTRRMRAGAPRVHPSR